MKKVLKKDLKDYGVKDGEWWSADFDVPMIATVISFVFDDPETRNWDNNENQDYHTPVSDPLTHEESSEILFKRIKSSYRHEADAEERAMIYAIERKIKSKVTLILIIKLNI